MADGADAPPAPAGVLGPARPPVRLLHAGHDHAGGLAPRARTRTRPRQEIREGISGNLCRCTGYVNIVKAIQQAAGELRAAESAPVVAAETIEGQAVSAEPAAAG